MSLWSRLERRLGDLASELVLDEYRDQLNQARQLLGGRRRGRPRSTSLEALLQVKPDHGQALILLGEARLATRDPASARRCLRARAEAARRAIRRRSSASDSRSSRSARTSLRSPPLGRAVAEAGGDRAILADAYRGLGIAWRRRGDLDKAIRELRKAVVEDGDDIDARAALGEALVADGGPYDEALRHLERAAAGRAAARARALRRSAGSSLIEDSPAIAGERLAKARASSPTTDATPLGAAAALRHPRRAGRRRARRTRRDARTRLLSRGAAARAAARRAPREDRGRASLDRQPRRRARELRPRRSRSARRHRAAARRRRHRDRRRRCDARDAVGQRSARQGSDRCPRARRARRRDDRATSPRPRVRCSSSRRPATMSTRTCCSRGSRCPRDPTARPRPSALAALRVAPHHAQGARDPDRGARRRAARHPRPTDIAELARVPRDASSRAARELGHLVGEVARAAANLDQPLLVTVMGEFSSGKSSFVNAFIGADVAPTGITPTTATINVVRYGRERGGRIITRDGTTLELGWDALMAHLRALTPDAAHARSIASRSSCRCRSSRRSTSSTRRASTRSSPSTRRPRARSSRRPTRSSGCSPRRRAARRARRRRCSRSATRASACSACSTRPISCRRRDHRGRRVHRRRRSAISSRRSCRSRARDALDLEADRTHAATTATGARCSSALEERFFQQARQLKRDACARVLRSVVADAQARRSRDRAHRAVDAADAARAGRDELIAVRARRSPSDTVLAERKALSEQIGHAVPPRRARGPRSRAPAPAAVLVAHGDRRGSRLPDRAALLGLRGRDRGAAAVASPPICSRAAAPPRPPRARSPTALGVDVVGDLRPHRRRPDRPRAVARVRSRARVPARLPRGRLRRGVLPQRCPAPRARRGRRLSRARTRGARISIASSEILSPAPRPMRSTALAGRLDHWGAVVDVQAFDLEVGISRALGDRRSSAMMSQRSR